MYYARASVIQYPYPKVRIFDKMTVNDVHSVFQASRAQSQFKAIRFEFTPWPTPG